MQIQALECFVVVAEEMNFHRAAERLGVTQPAISKRIGALEAELGIDLFVRERRGIAGLTAAGQRYLEDVGNILAEIDRTTLLLPSISSGKTGLLRLGICEAVSSMILLRILAVLRHSLPDIALAFREILPSEMPLAIRRKEIDLGFGFLADGAADLRYEWLWSEALMIAGPAGTAIAHGDGPVPETGGLDFYIGTNSTDPHAQDHLATAVLRITDPPPRIIGLAQRSTTITLAAAGIGMTLLPASFAQLGLAGIELVPLPGARIEVGVLYRSDDDNRSLRDALAVIKREARDVAG